jgi:hypothetical protein
MHRALLLPAVLGLAAWCQAQDDQRLFQPHHPSPQVVDTPVTERPTALTVTVDPRIEATMARYAELEHPHQGYRVQIFLGDRKTAEETKRTFLQKYPDVPVYLSYLAPNFRLRVGDLRTRLDAERTLTELRTDYPGSYIVPDEIGMPKLPTPAP